MSKSTLEIWQYYVTAFGKFAFAKIFKNSYSLLNLSAWNLQNLVVVLFCSSDVRKIFLGEGGRRTHVE